MKKCFVLFLCIFCLSACAPTRANKVVPPSPASVSPEQSNSVADASYVAKGQQAQYTVEASKNTQDMHIATSAPAPVWQLVTGSLYGQLDMWAAKADYQLIWQSDNDLQMMSCATFKGTFIEAIESLFGGLAKLGHSFTVTFYTGNRVLEVKED